MYVLAGAARIILGPNPYSQLGRGIYFNTIIDLVCAWRKLEIKSLP